MGGKGLDDSRDYFGDLAPCGAKHADKKILSSSGRPASVATAWFPKGFLQGLRVGPQRGYEGWLRRGSEGGYEGCAGKVPKGFRRGFRRVSEGVSEGFPWVSGGFREKVHIKRITEIIVFAKP